MPSEPRQSLLKELEHLSVGFGINEITRLLLRLGGNPDTLNAHASVREALHNLIEWSEDNDKLFELLQLLRETAPAFEPLRRPVEPDSKNPDIQTLSELRQRSNYLLISSRIHDFVHAGRMWIDALGAKDRSIKLDDIGTFVWMYGALAADLRKIDLPDPQKEEIFGHLDGCAKEYRGDVEKLMNSNDASDDLYSRIRYYTFVFIDVCKHVMENAFKKYQKNTKEQRRSLLGGDAELGSATLRQEIKMLQRSWAEGSHDHPVSGRPNNYEASRALDRRFVPSDALIDMTFRGLQARFDVLRTSNPGETLHQPTRERASEILAPRLFEVIASRGRRIKLGLLPNVPLAEEGTFDYGFVLELSEHLPFRIDTANVFFGQLYDDLTQYLLNGGKISGRWGRLVLHEQRIVFDVLDASQSTINPKTVSQPTPPKRIRRSSSN